MNVNDSVICIIGLGYVGLPLAVAFSRKFKVIGFDINESRVLELKSGVDTTNEVSSIELDDCVNLSFSHKKEDLKKANIYIVTVPTPINQDNMPDLTPLISASKLIGPFLSKDNLIVYESTVYPGVTEDVCVPALLSKTNLIFNKDFFVGYSPERINPGDKINRLENIVKVTSGSTKNTAILVDKIYKEIITAGTHLAPSIKVAEASKVIENIQRDVNIALINELYQVFNLLNIKITDVVNAASTKWNFMKLHPGLVGGHCIGVDPYYLIHKSQSVGYFPDLIKKAREINNSMPSYIVHDFLANLIKLKINPIDLKVLLIGFSFKPDCPDIRNTKVYDVYLELVKVGFVVDVFDPVVSKDKVFDEFGIKIKTSFDEISTDFHKVAFLATEHSDLCLQNIDFEYLYNYKD